jgi:hypothetical protein
MIWPQLQAAWLWARVVALVVDGTPAMALALLEALASSALCGNTSRNGPTGAWRPARG